MYPAYSPALPAICSNSTDSAYRMMCVPFKSAAKSSSPIVFFQKKSIPQIRDHQTVDKQKIAPDLPPERNWKNTSIPLFRLLRLLRKAVLIPFYEKW